MHQIESSCKVVRNLNGEHSVQGLERGNIARCNDTSRALGALRHVHRKVPVPLGFKAKLTDLETPLFPHTCVWNVSLKDGTHFILEYFLMLSLSCYVRCSQNVYTHLE